MIFSLAFRLGELQNGEYVWDLDTDAKDLGGFGMGFPAIFRVDFDSFKVSCVREHSSV